MNVVSLGCPCGIGPEIAVRAADTSKQPTVLVGDWDTVAAAARLCSISERRLAAYDPNQNLRPDRIHIHHTGPALPARARKPGRPSALAGQCQLAWVNAAFELVTAAPGRALVTGPVSKAAIVASGERSARGFRGHTEWLMRLDGAAFSVMCFVTPRFATSLVTTHLPLAQVAKRITSDGVATATIELAKLVLRLNKHSRRIAIASLNPHAGESELLGTEERQAIVPGIQQARRALPRELELVGPMGAETAYRLAQQRKLAGVVAMYHDQATIPTKLASFGSTVNVTLGLSIVRTSVDHGTGYDIAWQGVADPCGLSSALRLATRLSRTQRRG